MASGSHRSDNQCAGFKHDQEKTEGKRYQRYFVKSEVMKINRDRSQGKILNPPNKYSLSIRLPIPLENIGVVNH